MHMRKLLKDGKVHHEGIGRNSAQNSTRLGIVPTLIARVENLIIQEPLARVLRKVLLHWWEKMKAKLNAAQVFSEIT